MKIAYQKFNFRNTSLELIRLCNAIIAEYQADGFTLTLRQLYYQMVSRDHIPNTQKSYKNLGSVVNDARLAGLIDWTALEDRTRNVKSVSHWESPQDIIAAVAHSYRIDTWAKQKMRPEIWIEKDALVGVIDTVCRELDISYFSCRGYTSQSEMWGAAMRFIRYADSNQGVHVFHFGDMDPSGIDMSRDIEERIRMFMQHHTGSKTARLFEFTRVALNQDQVDQYNPPPNPAKATDSRFEDYQRDHGDESWELDALEPRVIAALIREEVEAIRDQDIYEDAMDEQTQERDQLQAVSDRWDEVVDFIGE